MTAEAYPGLPQTAKMQCFVTTVNDQKSVTIVSKSSIVDVWGKSGCTSVYFELTQYISTYASYLSPKIAQIYV